MGIRHEVNSDGVSLRKSLHITNMESQCTLSICPDTSLACKGPYDLLLSMKSEYKGRVTIYLAEREIRAVIDFLQCRLDTPTIEG